MNLPQPNTARCDTARMAPLAKMEPVGWMVWLSLAFYVRVSCADVCRHQHGRAALC